MADYGAGPRPHPDVAGGALPDSEGMPTSRLRRMIDWTGESLFVADVIVVGLVLFLVVLGAIDPLATPLLAVALALVVVLATARHRWARRNPDEVSFSHHRARERRGF